MKLGLRTKFFLYSNTLIAVTMTAVLVLSVVHERRSRRQEIEARGRSIVEAMVIPISQALEGAADSRIAGQGLVDDYLADILARNRDSILYTVVTDPNGWVTNSSRLGEVGLKLERASARGPDGAAKVLEVVDPLGRQPILEVHSAIAAGGRALGRLVVGFSMQAIEQQVAVVARRAVQVALVLMVFNSMVTAIYVETLISPILSLNRLMQRAGRGDLSVRAPVRSRDEVGELTDVFNRMMDELEEVRDQEKVRSTQLAHTEKMVAVGTLAAGVAHEVNNPLAGVLACIENLRASPDDVEMRERYLELIRDGLMRIERTVANLLNFSRQRGIRPEPTSLNHNLRHVAELVGYQLRKGEVEIRFDLDDSEAIVLADHFQMEQLFLNLMLNAVQAMPNGGTLTLRTRVRQGKVTAEVRDTGVGIPTEVRERIFDPFFTTREVGEGTGLGLAVSDSIVAAHGGSFEVDSEPGRGSVFRVILEEMPQDREPGEIR